MAAITICSDFGAQKNKALFPLFPHLFPMKWWDQMPWSSFCECWGLSQLFNSPLPLSSRGFWVPLHSLPGEGNGTQLQYSCLENPMDGGALWAAVHGVAKSRTWLSNWTELNWTERTKELLDESERGEWKSWLKTQHSKNYGHGIWSHHFMANRWGNMETMRDFILGASKSLQMVTAAMKFKDTCSLEEKLWPT